MNPVAAKRALHQEAMNIDAEQFEHFCKILVEEIENPHDIELTPFGNDGGIDIRGRYGQSFFSTHFGVQVKQYTTGTVGTPKMRNFIGALSQHEYQFGCFITSSTFVDDAAEIADDHSIILVNGDKLTDIMLSHELGVTYDGTDYELDSTFWDIFDQTETDELVQSDEIPQANSLSVLHLCLEAINDGRRYKPEIESYMIDKTGRDDWTPRQADYYPLAGYALGYVHKDTIGEYHGQEMRRWGLTREGTEYLELIHADERAKSQIDLNEHIRKSAIMARILPRLEEEGILTRDDVVGLVVSESEINDTTADRRMSTLHNWIMNLSEIAERSHGHSTKYEYISESLDDYVDDS